MRFSHLHEISALCAEESTTIGRLMIQEQVQETNTTEEEIFRQMSDYYEVMKEAVHRGQTQDTVSRS
ncbi:L-serine ammonia-lyase, iron-sulfur-dependent, subunit alpha, partial [Paenibacillus sp. EKM208P]